MHFNQTLHQGEPDPKAAFGSSRIAIDLSKHIKNGLQLIFRYTCAVILNCDDHIVILSSGIHPDSSSRFSVFTAVVKQVSEHLGQSGWVGIEVDRLIWQIHAEIMPCRIDERSRCFYCALNH